MVKELPKDIYFSKPKSFGNGARLKAYKKHINEEMIIMTKKEFDKMEKISKKYWKSVMNSKPISEKQAEKNERELAKKWMDAEDRNNDELIREIEK
jgi:ribosomal protein L35